MIVSFFEVEPWEEKYLKEKFHNGTINFFKSRLNAKTAQKAKNSDAISVFIYSKIDRKILDKFPKLKLIVTRSTGYDHIDVEECKARRIKIANVPFYGENTVAEHTFALILALSRKLIHSIKRAEKHDFNLKGLRGFDLKGKTLGIIGCGSIGQNVARMAKGFQMNVIVFDLKQNKQLAKKLDFKYATMNELFEQSDILTIHVPLNARARHLIDKTSLDKMKKGIIIINTSRGEIINSDHLINAIKKGKVNGAGLDVLEGESFVKEEKQLLTDKHSMIDLEHVIEANMLVHMDRVIVTPHNAFNSEEAVRRILDTTIQSLNNPKTANYV